MANTLNIKVENNRVLTESILTGVDISNVIATGSSGSWADASYTATEDCFAVGYGHYSGNNNNTHTTVKLENQIVFDSAKVDSGDQYGWVFMKKGQKLGVSGENNYYKIFGLKR